NALSPFQFMGENAWRLIEDVKMSYFDSSITVQNSCCNPPVGPKGGVLLLRKNIFYNFWNPGGGNYLQGVEHVIQEGNFYYHLFLNDGAFPVRITTGSPAIITWSKSLIGNANGVAINRQAGLQFAATGTLPSPLMDFKTGTTYYAVNIGTCAECDGNPSKFNLATRACTSFSGCSDGMVNIVSCKDRCSLSQSVIWSAAQANSIRTHTNYIQNNAAD